MTHKHTWSDPAAASYRSSWDEPTHYTVENRSLGQSGSLDFTLNLLCYRNHKNSSKKHINTHASLHLHYTNYIQFKCRTGAGCMKTLRSKEKDIFLLCFFLRRKCQDVMLSYFMAILDSLINWMINTSKAVFLHCLQIIIIITTSVQNFTMSLVLT